jgi:tight adherence protein B
MIVMAVAVIAALAVIFLGPALKKGPTFSHNTAKDTLNSLKEGGIEDVEMKMANSELTLAKKLKFGQWKMSQKTFHLYSAAVSFALFLIAFAKLNMIYQVLALFVGPSFMNSLLMRSVMARFKRFDKDYPPFLLSLVGLLKTGMNPMQALGTAAKSLDEDSLVREEVELMLERLRLGVAEERSIGAFGDEIYHAEIELFVQALLLSRRVGGTLSDTLERLAKQVRRRQYFRMMAVAAIGLQRGSIWFIIVIQVTLMTFIYFILPRFIVESLQHPIGWQVWQFGAAVMMLGMYWVRKVSNIRC